MLRVLLAVLAWPVVIFVAIWIFDWYDESYLNPPEEDAKPFEYDHPRFFSMANEALQEYAELSPQERDSFNQKLQSQLMTVDSWAAAVERTGFSILCVGEDHIDLTREFIAQELFSRLSVDILLLEATHAELASILWRMGSEGAGTELLGAQIGGVIQAVRQHNPQVVFKGIEETPEQKERRFDQERAGIRDDSIVKNLWLNFVPGKRHVILFGAIHCTNREACLYQQIRRSAPEDVLEGVHHLRVVERKQDSLIDPFLFFLDEIGMEKRDFVIADTSALDPRLLKWFALMNPRIFSQYRTLLVYRAEEADTSDVRYRMPDRFVAMTSSVLDDG